MRESSIGSDRDSCSPVDAVPDYCLAIEGMMCQKNCGSTAQKALASVPGVTNAIVTFQKKEAQIWGDVSPLLLIDAVECVGFDAVLTRDKNGLILQIKAGIIEKNESNVNKLTIITSKEGTSMGKKQDILNRSPSNDSRGNALSVIETKIGGMSCTSCVRSLENGLMKSKGVTAVRVALLAEKAEITFDSSAISADAIMGVISQLGYSGRVLSSRNVGENFCI